MNKPLEGKIAVVTGAGRSMGRVIALRLADEGANICVHYGASKGGAAETVREIEAKGVQAFSLGADLRSTDEIEALYEALDKELKLRFGSNRFDMLINNAGGGGGGGLVSTTTAQQFDDAFNLNVKGTFFMSQHAAPRLNNGGRIVNFSSVAARGVSGAGAAYKAAKTAVNAVTESLAAELGPRRITVNAIAPGATATDMIAGMMQNEAFVKGVEGNTAMGRLGTPEEIAGAVSLLVSEDAGWITGQLIEVSGGLRL